MRSEVRFLGGLFGFTVLLFVLRFCEQEGLTVLSEPEYVDLGLPSGTLWATRNVCADIPEEYGDHFSWGETCAKSNYDDGCKMAWKSLDDLLSMGVVDSCGNLTSQYDVATIKLGEDWRMPTKEEFEELLSLENRAAKRNFRSGRKFFGKNGKTLFLPFGGYRFRDKCDGYDFVGNSGGWKASYWSATVSDTFNCMAYSMDCSSQKSFISLGDRCLGCTVRPVYRKK